MLASGNKEHLSKIADLTKQTNNSNKMIEKLNKKLLENGKEIIKLKETKKNEKADAKLSKQVAKAKEEWEKTAVKNI